VTTGPCPAHRLPSPRIIPDRRRALARHHGQPCTGASRNPRLALAQRAGPSKLSSLLPPPSVLMRRCVQAAHTDPLVRLNVTTTFDVAAAARTIDALDAQGGTSRTLESSQAHQNQNQFRIVVLDTVTALLGPQLSGISSQGNVYLRPRYHPPPSGLLSCPTVLPSIS